MNLYIIEYVKYENMRNMEKYERYKSLHENLNPFLAI